MLETKISLVGVPEVIKQLEMFVPGAVTAMRKELKTITAKSIIAINSNIPASSPLMGKGNVPGMNHNGRTKYQGAKASFSLPISKIIADSDTHPLVQIKVRTPTAAAGFQIADMAGSGTGRGRRASTMSAEVKKVGYRTYRYTKNGQGKGMIDNLPNRSRSRYVYPAFQDSLPLMEMETLAVLDRYAEMVNRKIERI